MVLSQSGYGLFGTVGTQAGTRACRAPDREGSTGTARRPLLPGLDRRSVLRPPGAGPDRFAARAGYEVVSTFKETGSGVRLDRTERRKVMALAQARQIDAVLVTELSRWGRSTTDLLTTLKELEVQRVSVVALNGMTFDLATPHGRMMATVLAGIAEFERELTQERIRSGIAAAQARGKRIGRQPGQRPKSDRLAAKVMALIANGRSYRLIGRELGLS
jgi:putative DNA-invertase from lambdoid prophage Rac